MNDKKGKRLSGKVAVITGGARGIGEGIAHRYAEEGADIIIADLKEKEATETISRIESFGRKGESFAADATDEKQVIELVRYVIGSFGKIDILVNNAGISLMKKITEASVEDWDKLNSVNLKGVWLCVRAVVPHMIKAGYGKIINISSISGLVGYKWESIYCSTKGGVINMTRELAVELAPEGIYVNCICPGIIETPLYKDIDFPLDDKENLEHTLKAIPMKKIGMPGDIAGAAFFFASEDSRFVTGQILAVDGGYTSI
ncbi:MAG: SDR family oxidoreductase [Actinomycetia bacterium]|nr:SDR family oxidoreductase [Actinomycetes bacterium]